MINIFIFGDSISFGKDLNSCNNWVNLLYKKISKGKQINIYNLSIPGNSTNDLLDRLENEINYRSKNFYGLNVTNIAVLALGVNDTKSVNSIRNISTTKSLFYVNIKRIITILNNYNFKIIFNSILPVHDKGVEILKLEGIHFDNKIIAKYNKIIEYYTEKKGVKFINLNKRNWGDDDYLTDGIHLSKKGHNKYLKFFYEDIGALFLNDLNPNAILKQMYKIGNNQDILNITTQLIGTNWLSMDTPLLLGSFYNQIPDYFINGICLKRDIYGLSLNSFYQILMPVILGKKFNKPVIIFLPIKEEILLNQDKENKYIQLGKFYEKLIKNISIKIGVNITIINTNHKKYSNIIEENFNTIETDIDYNNIFNLTYNNNKHYSNERISIIKRELTANSYLFLENFFGDGKFCNVSDIEQFRFNIHLKEINKKFPKKLNYIGFLPLPNIDGDSSFFASPIERNIFLGKNKEYYDSHLMSELSKKIYNYFFLLLNKECNLKFKSDIISDRFIEINNYFGIQLE